MTPRELELLTLHVEEAEQDIGQPPKAHYSVLEGRKRKQRRI